MDEPAKSESSGSTPEPFSGDTCTVSEENSPHSSSDGRRKVNSMETAVCQNDGTRNRALVFILSCAHQDPRLLRDLCAFASLNHMKSGVYGFDYDPHLYVRDDCGYVGVLRW